MSDEIKTSDLLHRIFEIRRARADLKTQDQALQEEFNQIEQVLLARADDQGATRISTSDGTAIVSEEIVPTITDWDALYAYIKENDAFHFLQRRVASAAYREALTANQEIPGLAPYTKRSLNFRAAK
jgi:hypothetical protein